jgi:hypothetical protein
MSAHQRFLNNTPFPSSVLWKPEDMGERTAGVKDPDVIRERHSTLNTSAAQDKRNQDVIIVVGTVCTLVATVIADNTNRRVFKPARGLPSIQNLRNAAVRTRDGI